MNCIWLLLILCCFSGSNCGNDTGGRNTRPNNNRPCRCGSSPNNRPENNKPDCGCENVCETVCDAVRDVARDTAREVVRDTARDIARDNAEEGCGKRRNFQYNTSYPVLDSCD